MLYLRNNACVYACILFEKHIGLVAVACLPGSAMTQARKQPNASTVLSVSTRRLETPGTEKLSHGITYGRHPP